MMPDHVDPNEPLQHAINVLRATPAVAIGLAERTRHRARLVTRRRRVGVVVTLGAALLTALLVRPAARSPGEVTFALVAPASSGVSLVGDFTDWETDRVRLEPAGRDRWEVTLTLPPGRYRFAYLTDEGEWLADDHAPPALDEFGSPTSMLTVKGE